jgi:hypothetical protein
VAQQYPERDLIDVIVTKVLRVPWWVSCMSAVVSFLALRAVSHALVPSVRMNSANSGSVLTQELLSAMAAVAEVVVPLVLMMASVLSLKHRINAGRRLRRAKRLAQQRHPAQSTRRTL